MLVQRMVSNVSNAGNDESADPKLMCRSPRQTETVKELDIHASTTVNVLSVKTVYCLVSDSRSGNNKMITMHGHNGAKILVQNSAMRNR